MVAAEVEPADLAAMVVRVVVEVERDTSSQLAASAKRIKGRQALMEPLEILPQVEPLVCPMGSACNLVSVVGLVQRAVIQVTMPRVRLEVIGGYN